MSSYLEIRVGMSTTITDNSVCYYYAAQMPKHTTIQWYCSQPLNGNYVTVQKVAGAANKPLVLYEVEVFPPKGQFPLLRWSCRVITDIFSESKLRSLDPIKTGLQLEQCKL